MLLHGLAYNVMHCARVLTEQASGQGWGLQRLRDMVLRAPARIIVHARYATVVLGEATAARVVVCPAHAELRPGSPPTSLRTAIGADLSTAASEPFLMAK